MKINKSLLIAAAFTGLLCGIWAGFAGMAKLSVWAGFAGCTAYFATGKHGLAALKMTLATNVLGTLSAVGMIYGGNMLGSLPGSIATTIAVGFFVMLIVLCSAIPWVAFVPGIFVGCYTLFGMGGDGALATTILSLMAGGVLGLACDMGGAQLVKKLVP